MKIVVLFASLCLTAITAQIIDCPSCSDPYDPSSCTGTQTCHNSKDVCELHVHLADNNRVEYVCHNSHACTNHEQHACDAINHESCAYCCSSIEACRIQREDLFTNVFSTSAPSAGNMTAPPAVTNGTSADNSTMI